MRRLIKEIGLFLSIKLFAFFAILILAGLMIVAIDANFIALPLWLGWIDSHGLSAFAVIIFIVIEACLFIPPMAEIEYRGI